MSPALFKFLKLAASATSRQRVQEKLDQHFSATDKKRWQQFRRDLRQKSFADAVQHDDRADDKLRQYAKMVHLHKTGTGPSFPVKSDTSGRRYTVKYHPGVERYTCSCPDWTIKHTIDGGDCKHIRKLKSQVSMVKEASQALRELLGLGRAGLQVYRTEGNDEKAWHAGQVSRVHRVIANKTRQPAVARGR